MRKFSKKFSHYLKPNTNNYGRGLANWIGKWDQEIEADSEAGKLDVLIVEANEEKEKGILKDL